MSVMGTPGFVRTAFGSLLGALSLVGALLPGVAAGRTPADTTSGYIESLREHDIESYSPELLQSDPAVRDSALAALDSLGYEGFARSRREGRRWTFDLVPASRLLAYDRVEGLTLGLGVEVTPSRGDGPTLAVQAAWATASGEFRHFSELAIPVGPVVATGGFADRVIRFGSNRVPLNFLRALIGGADDQDYLHRKGGWAGFRVRPGASLSLGAVYAANRARTLRTRGVWSLFGDLEDPNPAIGEGMMRSVDLELEAGSMQEGRESLSITHRIAGGELGGDFSMTRTDVSVVARRYLPGKAEALATAGWTGTGGDTPIQELADVGGLSTVRGFARRTRVGERSLRAGLELFLPWDPLAATRIPVLEKGRIQAVLWGDAARVWEGGADTWLTSAGVGLQRYLGPFDRAANLRLDVAFPTGPERPDDVTVYLRFSPGLF